MESPQRDPGPPTLPTTIHAGPDSMHAETDYHLPILRMYALLISPELRILRHPTISRHHPSMPVLTQSSTVLHHRDTDRITSSMPYHDPRRKKAKR